MAKTDPKIPTRLPAKIKITEADPNKPKQNSPRTLLTEELPAGGVTQEDFKHQGRNVVEDDEDEDDE